MSEYTFIDQPAALSAACREMRRHDWLALDTEFIREKTFYPKLCLIQVATPELQLFCIDPLAALDIAPLLDVFYDPGITKVLHAARQDLEIFHQLRGRLPGPVFDTQLAAPLLGLAEQMGYAGLVRERLGVELPKGHSRTDWAQRPLSEAQLGYAADDVNYLAQLYPPLHDELAAKGRLEWLAPDFQTLLEPATYIVQPEAAWLRIKEASRLKGASLAVLQDLAAWREERARREDKPRKWILPDDALATLARLKPERKVELERVRGLNPGLIRLHGDDLIQRVQAARGREPQPLPAFTRRPPLTAAEEAALDLLQGALRLIADTNDLNPAVLGGRKELERLLRGHDDCALLQGWRRRLAGDTLQAVLAGEYRAGIRAGRLELEPPLGG
ncbi:MAG TPA: ribonuclease D [Thiohalobacter sp.]|nr:ribonuclease D [Thiohalobacter sp.]